MAEHLNQPKPEALDPMSNMGKPVGMLARSEGYKHVRAMGLVGDDAYAVVACMAEGLERDDPYGAMHSGMRYLDITGVYRLMAVLLTHAEPKAA